MYSYNWDNETGGYLLTSTQLQFSKEPRPVYYRELDLLGFDTFYDYEKDDKYPYMWAEANNYIYHGKVIAKARGGSLYCKPELEIQDETDLTTRRCLQQINIPLMIDKNKDVLEQLVQATIKKVYNTYENHKKKVDIFYVAFSGGKDSIVALDIVQRALPHDKFKVLFGDTGMEFPDTYEVVEKVKKYCSDIGVEFYRAKSKMTTEQTWKAFGPPAVTNRWCCTVHKTSPQVILLQELVGATKFTGMAFTGVRGDESTARSEYESVSYGEKHKGQYSCHPILEWNSAELFLYIYTNNLIINEAYKKGNSRAGCLVCPMSSGKHEYIKRFWYTNEVDYLINKIIETSGKTNFTIDEMKAFIDAENWKTRKSGRELNFGYDKHVFESTKEKTTITVQELNPRWKEWIKTLGKLITYDNFNYSIEYGEKNYRITFSPQQKDSYLIEFPNCDRTKDDLKFISLFRSVIVKSIYCVNCGVCVAECSFGCINMNDGKLIISDNCHHCHHCHEIHEHCIRYNSIRNKIGTESTMKGLGRYFSFGVRENWMKIFFKYKGSEEFWNSDGDSAVANKKKDAFLNFIKDAGIVTAGKAAGKDKYTKYELTDFGKNIINLDSDSEILWALLLCNLVYTSDFNWFIKNIDMKTSITPEQMKIMLSNVMENDVKGVGKRNVVDAFKIMLVKTPLGNDIGLGICDYLETSSGTITLNSFYRDTWKNVDSRVILYSLYRFAEMCGDYYQFTLSRLLDHDIDSSGISPTEIFGLERVEMEKILNGLSVNYPDFISCSFTLDLDNITLRNDKKSNDVLSLIIGE